MRPIKPIQLTAILLMGVFLYACQQPMEGEEDYNLYEGLETVEGASNTSVTINQGEAVGRDAWFEFEVGNIAQNDWISAGTYDGWCIEWTKPIAQQGDQHDNVRIYSTYGSEKYKPLNHFLNIKKELQSENPTMNFREAQAIIWSVTRGPEFDLNTLSVDELPTRLTEDGEPNFDMELVKTIANRIEADAPDYEYSRDKSVALFMKTGEDEQDVMVPSEPGEVSAELTVLGTLPGTDYTEALAINNRGQITGDATGSIFLWEENTGMRDLGTLSDFTPARGYDINAEGQIAAQLQPNAYIWDEAGGYQILSRDANPRGINNDGVVVGFRVWEDVPFIGTQAIMWDENRELTILETLAESLGETVDSIWFNRARDINNRGQIVGESAYPSDEEIANTHAVIWEDGEIARDLGTLGGDTEGHAINDRGQVVGMSHISDFGANTGRPFIWDEENGMRNLGLGPFEEGSAVATGINNHGQVVGYILLPQQVEGIPNVSAFYWDEVHGMIPLEGNHENATTHAWDINDNGVVVGRMITDDPDPETVAVKWEITIEDGEAKSRIIAQH